MDGTINVTIYIYKNSRCNKRKKFSNCMSEAFFFVIKPPVHKKTPKTLKTTSISTTTYHINIYLFPGSPNETITNSHLHYSCMTQSLIRLDFTSYIQGCLCQTSYMLMTHDVRTYGHIETLVHTRSQLSNVKHS